MKQFLTVIIVALCCYTTISAQKPKEREEIRQSIWAEKNREFDVKEFPEKWNNESAVILAKIDRYSYKKPPLKKFSQEEFSRRRVKLLDKAAVESYSELNFYWPDTYYGEKGENFWGVFILKSNGKKIELKDEDGVEVTEDGYQKIKVAIPDLEPGDIIDYFQLTTLTNFGKEKVFNPIVYTLPGSYPILIQTLEFEVDNKCYLNCKSLNGAPEVKKKRGDNETTIYRLVDTTRDRIKDMRWTYSMRNFPTIKFQAFMASNVNLLPVKFIGKPEMVKSSVTKKEIDEYIKGFGNGYYEATMTDYAKWLKKNKKTLNKDNAAEEVYNYLRYYYAQGEPESSRGFNGINNHAFISLMKNILDQYKIPYEVLMGVPRSINALDDLILDEEVSFFLKIGDKDPYYVYNFGRYTNFADIPYLLEDIEVYAYNSKTKKIEKKRTPSSSADQNGYIANTIIKFDPENMQLLHFDSENIIKGHGKSYYQSRLMQFNDYIEPLQEKYGVLPSQKAVTKKKKEEADRNKLDDFNETRISNRKKMIEGDFDEQKLESFDDIAILEFGLDRQNPDFKFKEQYKVDGYVKKVGPNYVFDAGKLIGGQISLDDDDMERDHDVHMDYARSFEYNIEVIIPDGYTVEGIENLNFNVDNAAGAFISTAKIEGNKLVMKTTKRYNTNYVKASDWPLMIDYLEAAYKFTQQKVLLKKA